MSAPSRNGLGSTAGWAYDVAGVNVVMAKIKRRNRIALPDEDLIIKTPPYSTVSRIRGFSLVHNRNNHVSHRCLNITEIGVSKLPWRPEQASRARRVREPSTA